MTRVENRLLAIPQALKLFTRAGSHRAYPTRLM